MSELKRDIIKYIRDLSKSSYAKASDCYICGVTKELQFHHVYSLTPLWEKWQKKHKIIINNVEDIKCARESFKADHTKEIYTDTLTLCKFCHMEKLHKIYGKSPSLATAQKQLRWAKKLRDKRILNKSEKV